MMIIRNGNPVSINICPLMYFAVAMILSTSTSFMRSEGGSSTTAINFPANGRP